ncbi:hypothetical protein HDU80_007178 [Chytriomyces hyalinus]|nr:hypothetical protein HDU80_007178 [Chytriomyces hyalinus]
MTMTYAALRDGARALVSTATGASNHAAFKFWTKVEATIVECEGWKVSPDTACRHVAKAMGEDTLGNGVDTVTRTKIRKEALEEARLEQARIVSLGRGTRGSSSRSSGGQRASITGCTLCQYAGSAPHNAATGTHWCREKGCKRPQCAAQPKVFGDGRHDERSVPRHPSIEDVLTGQKDGDPQLLSLRSPDHFVAGGINASRLTAWRCVTANLANGAKILNWVENSVDVEDFWASDARPVHTMQPNHGGLNHVLLSFLNATLEEDLRSGAAELVGPCETTPPPFLVYPIGVEPTKPRCIGDARYLNSFTTAPKHHPETLRHLARWARSLLTVADVKACYYNFCLKESSWKYFGFSWDYKGKKC